MRAERVDEIPVLIAGAGPAGLAAAAALARYGVESLLVERRVRPSSLPRATVVSTRSMEILRSLGLEDKVRAGGVEVEWLALVCDTLASAADGAPAWLGLPTREQSALLSPTSPACVPQDHLEPVLLRHLRASASVRVEAGTELELLSNGPDGVVAALRGGDDGRARVVRARHLVAADGAHSRVRATLGIPMEGPGDLGRVVSTLFRAPLWDLVGPRRYGLYDVTRPGGAGVLLPAGRDDRWLYGTWGELGRGDLAGDPRETMSRRIRLATGVPRLAPRIERIGAFAFAAQVAARFRDGSAFLAGDAAHRMTPRGGTGMNTAIQDGWDLGWKLAWAHHGWAGPDLLDSYEAERAPRGPAQRREVRGRGPGRPRRRSRPLGRPRRPHPPPLAPRDGRLDPRPAGPGAHAPHRPGGGAAGRRRGRARGPARRDPRPRRDQRPRHGHPRWRRAGRPPRRSARGLVAGRRLRRAAGSRPRSR